MKLINNYAIRFGQLWLELFLISGIVFIPFTFLFHQIQLKTTQFVFGNSVDLIANTLGKTLVIKDFSSDSIQLYVLCLFLSLLSFLTAGIIVISKKNVLMNKISAVSKNIAVYYLAWVLFKYGMDKIFKTQFYLPEPNLLYTNLGQLDKDILFWSTMGSSYTYNLFMGFIEVIPAILLIFKNTRSLGLILSFGVLLNVFFINLSFDISVKLFSGFLLLINLYLLKSTFVILWEIFIQNKTNLKHEQHQQKITRFNGFILKSILILVILFDTLSPYFKSKNFNDDLAERPFLHGSYTLERIIQNNDTLTSFNIPIKRIFIHRDSYMIMQNQQDEMVDFKMTLNEKHNSLQLTDYDSKQQVLRYSYNKSKDELTLEYTKSANRLTLICKRIDWRRLPLMRKQFHWTVDEI